MNYSIKVRVETITQNITLTDKNFCSWFAVNIGMVPVTVYGITLQPSEGLCSKDIIPTTPGDRWEEPIPITITTGGALRLARSITTPIK